MSARPITPDVGAARPRSACGTPCSNNDKLRDVRVIGLGRIEGAGGRDPRPQRQPLRRLTPRRHRPLFHARLREAWRSMPNRRQPLGMAFDREDNLYVCVGGMGLYRVTPDARSKRRPTKPIAACFRSTTTPTSGLPTISTSPMTGGSSSRKPPCATRCTNGRSTGSRRAATAGSFATTPNQHDPHGLARPEISQRHLHRHDGQSILFAETWGCRSNAIGSMDRRAGKVEIVIDNLPGYPDNINRASDGNYWLAIVGMRCPALDLA